ATSTRSRLSKARSSSNRVSPVVGGLPKAETVWIAVATRARIRLLRAECMDPSNSARQVQRYKPQPGSDVIAITPSFPFHRIFLACAWCGLTGYLASRNWRERGACDRND